MGRLRSQTTRSADATPSIGADESILRELAVLDPIATVTYDVERLRSIGAISPRIAVSGYVYDVLDGLVQTVLPAAACS